MANLDSFKKYNHIHMIGIGGISMSGIAEILNNWGITVTGSDAFSSNITNRLSKAGIHVSIGPDFENLEKSDLVVYSAAIKQDDPEMQKARSLNIYTMERADFLGKITEAFSNTIAISGTHGKTTTTSMVSACFLKAALDPTIQVGAILKEIDGNYRVGDSEYFILEACEYVESFLKFRPKSEIILNIDNDHLDYFKNFENIKNAFIKYVQLLPEDGLLVLNGDDKNCLDLRKFTSCRNVVTYGIDNTNANFVAKNIVFDKNGFPSFDVYYNNNFYATFKLSVSGVHNISDALSCIALCDYHKISKANMKAALKEFTGASRRLEYKGHFNNVSLFDDYAHHPTEITATCNAIKNKTYNKSWVVFQPHTYSRTKELLDDFAKSLLDFDNIIVTDIYAAREYNTYDISSNDVVDKIKSYGKDAKYMSTLSEIAQYLKSNTSSGDIVISLGAGTITNLADYLL